MEHTAVIESEDISGTKPGGEMQLFAAFQKKGPQSIGFIKQARLGGTRSTQGALKGRAPHNVNDAPVIVQANDGLGCGEAHGCRPVKVHLVCASSRKRSRILRQIYATHSFGSHLLKRDFNARENLKGVRMRLTKLLCGQKSIEED